MNNAIKSYCPFIPDGATYISQPFRVAKFGGFGFTEGCKGCRAIITGKNPVAHSPECRLKIMEQAPNNDKIAARVKRAMGKDREFHSKNLERNEEKKKKESEMQSSTEPATAEGSAAASASPHAGGAAVWNMERAEGAAARAAKAKAAVARRL